MNVEIKSGLLWKRGGAANENRRCNDRFVSRR